jgi:hypothetical protein
MAESFDVKSISIALPGTGNIAATAIPLVHFPASGGAVTILEAQISAATAMTHGTVNLFYGTPVAADGTIVPIAGGTIGTAVGTTGALSPVSITLTATPCIVPANRWLCVRVQTNVAAAAQSRVNICYVTGR